MKNVDAVVRVNLKKQAALKMCHSWIACHCMLLKVAVTILNDNMTMWFYRLFLWLRSQAA